MLTVDSVGLILPGAKDPLLSEISLLLPVSHFAAIVGSSGCGKSTLLKTMAGIKAHTSGNIRWRGRDLNKWDLPPSELGYVPQFTCAQPRLTVEENILYTAKFRTSSRPRQIQEIVDWVMEKTGLSELRNRTAGVLSGGQSRRLALAMELTTNPSLLLADEVTSGLDPRSEEEITTLLVELARDPNRLVILVTHSLRFLDLYDSVTVLTGGRLAFSGQSTDFVSYFHAISPEDVYLKLLTKNPVEWGMQWSSFKENSKNHNHVTADLCESDGLPLSPDSVMPSLLSQSLTWLSRRLKLFFRDRSQVLLQFALLFIFPLVVTLFAYQGLPLVKNMTMGLDTDLVQQLSESLDFTLQTSRIGTLVSGLIMFQAILLALMGSNNSAREIVSNRIILEKEKLAGLRPEAILLGVGAFFSLLVLLQTAWMTFFVRTVCQFPGDFIGQFLPFVLLTAAMTTLCLAISSWCSTSEQASLGSLYLVGFQLPLSGVILALPDFLGWFIRPTISAYWAWSGYLQTLKDTRFYDLIQAMTDTPIASSELSIWILTLHLGIGLFLTYFGIRRNAWV